MKTTSLIVPVGMLTLFLSGCPSSPPPSEQAATPTPSPSPQASPSPPPAFEEALQPRKVPTPQKVAGLIPATNPNQIQGTVQLGRSDPFAMIPIEPIVQFPPEKPVKRVPKKISTPVAMRPTRPNLPSLPPALPQPNEALGVVVSGVMDLPTSPVAIVKAPGESVVRRVTPGSTLSNGQVRVKAIYAENSNPMVVLEQYGVEVIKRVGEGVVEAPKAI
ncbi:hypothetical protein C7H19_04605 [Aphanothece hegewaldii CCALA 016]|uniref:Uncharacterized protein n=1 Tax=Aphanothece hegewaldii CCALA 016 TaxID=2107694 RepID=A0A2T1M2D0_9CHRO|nr:hypothetical protein [Aphanothece hegewaldii]PSF38785.1 hypothetical protein C7H19_04605 [Aphanothece hegewaldii CCALA 016]